MFKLMRLWNVTLCDETYILRKIPPERKGFETQFTDDIRLTALFAPSERYKLVESYGLNCYTETENGLLFEFGFENRSFLLNWLLSFGDKVKVIEPGDIIKEIQSIAENILSRYNQT